MIFTLTLLLLFQLAGTAISHWFGLALPGPVIGMVGLFALFMIRPALADRMRETVSGLLAHLSLLFVPAGVGIVGHLDKLAQDGVGLMVAIFGSTILALLAGVAAFLAVARITGAERSDP